MKRKKERKLIKFTLILILFTIAIYLSFASSNSYSKFEEKFKDLGSLISRLLIYPVGAVTTQSPGNQSESYIIQKNINKSLEQEIEELKDVLKLNRTLTEYDVINATVLSRKGKYWFNTITIDKGRKDGVVNGLAVITNAGLIGKITKVSQKSSEVKLLTSDDITYKTSVVIRTNNKDNYAILNGYNQKKNLLTVTAIDKSNSLSAGDTVLTSGLGGMPQGIYIGTVVSSKVDNYNLGQIVYIEPSQDYNNIHYVTILKEKSK